MKSKKHRLIDNPEVRKVLCLFIIFLLGVLVVYLGHNLNRIAIAKNNNKMPVKSNELLFITDDTHTHYINNKQVNVWWLTDIFHFDGGLFGYYFKVDKGIFSIGDYLMIIGRGINYFVGIISIPYLIALLIKSRWRKK